MNLTDDERAGLHASFASHVDQHLPALAEGLRQIEEAGRGTVDPAVADRLRYEAHAVRGAAALVGLVDVAEAARSLERALGEGAAAEGSEGIVTAVRALVAALEAHRPAGTGASPPTAPGDHRPLVLHIEDNEANRNLLAAVLALRPAVGLIEAADGEEGLRLAATPGVVLVLLDLRLPRVSGEAVLARLRADEATRHLRVVVVSAEARIDERDRLFAAGADDYIVKPYDVEHVLATVDHALARVAP